MRKTIFALTLVFTLIGGTAGACPAEPETTVIESNVGDGLTYLYVVTEVGNGEVHGTPLNRESETNRGIFLFADELSFDVAVGDEIAVVWGEVEDEFQSIEKVGQ